MSTSNYQFQQLLVQGNSCSMTVRISKSCPTSAHTNINTRQISPTILSLMTERVDTGAFCKDRSMYLVKTKQNGHQE